MMRKSRARASSLFLMELILAILFFSAASGICVQFFVRSHLLSRDSDALSHAVNECSGIAETVCAADSKAEAFTLLQSLYPDGQYPGAAEENNASREPVVATAAVYYDSAFHPCKKADAAYLLTLQLAEIDGMLDAGIWMQKYVPADAISEEEKNRETAKNGDDGKPDAIYELNIQHHMAGRTGYEKR